MYHCSHVNENLPFITLRTEYSNLCLFLCLMKMPSPLLFTCSVQPGPPEEQQVGDRAQRRKDSKQSDQHRAQYMSSILVTRDLSLCGLNSEPSGLPLSLFLFQAKTLAF